MTVYRIQSKQDRKRGAYCSHIYGEPKPTVVCDIEYAHGFDGDIEHHPPPVYDIGIKRYIEKKEHCGFETATQLLRWFKGYIPALLRAGYEIVALDNVSITAIGEYQVLFNWKD